MNIGLIGPGDIGSVIVRKLRDAGYSVKMANERGPESLKDLAAEKGAIPVSIEQVVQDVDILFIVLPQKAIPELPKGLLNKAKKETIVIDVGNYYPFRVFGGESTKKLLQARFQANHRDLCARGHSS